MSGKLNIFISHYRKHKTLPKVLRDLLITYGYNCWLQSDDVNADGEVIIDKTNNIEKCDVVILLIDQSYILSKRCMNDAKLAGQKDKITIPILLEKFAWPISELGRNYETIQVGANLYGSILVTIERYEQYKFAYQRIL